jgi:hypothetical protein
MDGSAVRDERGRLLKQFPMTREQLSLNGKKGCEELMRKDPEGIRARAVANLKLINADKARYEPQRLAGLRKSEKAKQAARRVSIEWKEKRLATRSRNPRSAKGEAHCSAIIWRIRDYRGKTYEFKNLAEFIRRHSDLFDANDVVWTQRTNSTMLCLAYSGIQSLRPYRRDGTQVRRVQGSWKGWTWISGLEDEQTPRRADLLDRQNAEVSRGDGSASQPQEKS